MEPEQERFVDSYDQDFSWGLPDFFTTEPTIVNSISFVDLPQSGDLAQSSDESNDSNLNLDNSNLPIDAPDVFFNNSSLLLDSSIVESIDLNPLEPPSFAESDNFLQLAHPANSGEDLGILDLNYDTVATPLLATSTSFEQHSASRSSLTGVQIGAVNSFRPLMTVNGGNLFDPSDFTPDPTSVTQSPQEVVTTSSTSVEQLASSSSKLPFQHKNHLLQPKALATSENTSLPPAQSLQGFLSAVESSSNVGPVSHGIKRKRSQSPQMRRSGVPDNYLCIFSAIKEFGAAKEDQQRSTAVKRKKVAKACLRCQMQRKRVSTHYTREMKG